MKLRQTHRKIRMSKKLRVHINQTKRDIVDLRMSGSPVDIQVANLLDESIGLNLLQYNSPGFTDGQKKAKFRLDQIQKELNDLIGEKEEEIKTKFYSVTT